MRCRCAVAQRHRKRKARKPSDGFRALICVSAKGRFCQIRLFFDNFSRPGECAEIEGDVVGSGLGALEVSAVEWVEVVKFTTEANRPLVVGAEFPFVAFGHGLSDSEHEVVGRRSHLNRVTPAVEAAGDAEAFDLGEGKIFGAEIQRNVVEA